MHEWALAEAVIQTVMKHVREREKVRVKSVTVLFGELQKIDREIFQTGLQAILKDQSLDVGVFRYDTEKASFLCNSCQLEWEYDDVPGLGEEEKEAIHFLPEVAHVYMRCPHCGSPDFKVEKGRGVSIESIILEEDGE